MSRAFAAVMKPARNRPMHRTTDDSARVAAIGFANRLVPFFHAELGPELLGILSSLAHGGFGWRYSDIDIAVITESGLSTQTLDRVRGEAIALSADLGSMAFRLLDRPAFYPRPISSFGSGRLPLSCACGESSTLACGQRAPRMKKIRRCLADAPCELEGLGAALRERRNP
jgi:hypothetical protein